ncbi:MAG: universal stress protein [Myxococcales bacterium]|nr:universal stress protein [Myxococcales bacterium]
MQAPPPSPPPSSPPATDVAPARRRGTVLLVFAGTPSSATLATMLAAAANLGRTITSITVGVRTGAVLVTEPELARAAAAARASDAAVVVVAGGTSARVVRRLTSAARLPVLVARTRQPWSTVVSATDLQAPGTPVLAAGSAVAATRHAEFAVVHNVTPAWQEAAALDSTGGTVAAHVARRLRRLARLAAAVTPTPAVVVCAGPEAPRAIVDACVARGADLVVVGMRRPRATRTDRCADHVVASTPGNVLVVPLGARRRARAVEVTA